MKFPKILLCGNSDSIYVQQTQDKLRNLFSVVDILDIAKGYILDTEGGVRYRFPGRIHNGHKFNKLVYYYGLNVYLRNLNLRYDVVHIHYNDPAYSVFFIKTLKAAGNNLIISIWGSDFNKKNAAIRNIQKISYIFADGITFNSKDIMNRFNEYYRGKFRKKLSMLYFGIDTLSSIENRNDSYINLVRENLLPGIKNCVITIGYNGIKEQNHIKVLKVLEKYLRESEVSVILPMTYGASDEYLKEVGDYVAENSINAFIIDNRLSMDEIAVLRLVSDIFINVQNTDSFSASMQEYLFAGNVVINGSWLPYAEIRSIGMYDIQIGKIEDLSEMIPEIVDNLNSYKNLSRVNKDIIWNISSWNKNIERWKYFYSNVIEKE